MQKRSLLDDSPIQPNAKLVKIMKKIICVVLFICCPVLSGAQQENYNNHNSFVPTYHWIYDYLTELKVRGYLGDLNLSVKPISAAEILKEIQNIADSKPATAILAGHLRRSYLLKTGSDSAKGRLMTQLFLKNYTSFDPETEKWQNRFIPRGRISFQFGGNLAVQSSFLTDNRLDENKKYLGKRQSGIASYSEESYIIYSPKHFNFLLGRSFVRWGPGATGSLLLSDFSRPLDQMYADFSYKWLRFFFLTASLNTVSVNNTVANRYFSAHRLNFQLRKNIWLGISETVIYGGPNAAPQLAFHIPVIFYHGVILNGPTLGNTMGSIDISCYPAKNMHLYGELLIDDIQLEKSGPVDLEPNEWGLLIGIQSAYQRFFWETEYVRVTNRTYKTPDLWESYTFRNDPLGYFLGNDFDHLRIRGNYWLRSDFRLQTILQFIRRGAGRIDTPFDTPWMSTPAGEDYREPFPTGIVEKLRRFQLELRWHPGSSFGYGEVPLGYENINSIENEQDKNSAGWFFNLGFWLEFGKSRQL